MSEQGAPRPVYSIVIPIYNEEAVVPLLLHRLDQLLPRLDGPAEVIFVDDGSRDTSSIVLAARARENPIFKYIALSRNFGQQIAATAGLDHARGDAIIVMDADLQDPPELVLEMAAKWREGFDIVYAQRIAREGESSLKKTTSHLFYRLMSKLASVEMPRNVSDFRLIDRKVLRAFSTMREQDRFVRGMFAWMGFRQTAVQFHRPARAAGITKYSYTKLAKLAIHALISFSDAPLRMALWFGIGVSAVAVAYAMWVIGSWLVEGNPVAGWSSLMVVTAFLSGVNMFVTGVMGLYVGRIHNQVKGRPLYLVGNAVGFDRALGVDEEEKFEADETPRAPIRARRKA